MKLDNMGGNTAATRRSIWMSGLILTILAVMLAACGEGGNSGNSGNVGNVGNGAPSNADTPADQAGGANAQNTGAASDASPDSATKTVKHLFGETVIPTAPQRVASIGLEDMLLSLEVPLAQANGMEGYYLYDRLTERNIPLLYAAGGLNYEGILAAQPDLIIVLSGLVPDQATYEKLSQIAPTLVYDRDEWKTSIVEVGEALGRADQANAVIQAYDDTLKQAREKIVQAVGTGRTVALVRPSDKDVQIFFPRFAYGSVLYNDLGLAPAAGVTAFQDKSDEETSAGSLSLEELPTIDADYLFVTAGGSLSLEADFKKALEAVSGVEQLQLWQTIPAVKQDQVYKLSARHWMLSGPIADTMKIADVVAAVTGQPGS